MKLTDFKVLTFDCYGTLIDWEAGIERALAPLASRTKQTLTRDELLVRYGRHESAQEEETPALLYSRLLPKVYERLAAELQVTPAAQEPERFGASVPDWPAFPDSAAALRYLKRHYRLVILSNVDRQSFAASNRRLEVEFDAVYTAEDIGSYKPDLANFKYLLTHLQRDHGFGPRDVLHVAQSLFHDHAPANRMGLASAWIDRRHNRQGWGATAPPPDGTHYDFRFESMAALAAAHQAEHKGR